MSKVVSLQRLRIVVPATWRLGNESAPPWRLFSDSLNGSGILIDSAPFTQGNKNLNECLLQITERFINDSVLKADRRQVLDIETEYSEDDVVAIATTLITMEDGYGWLIMLTCDITEHRVYVLHFNGPLTEAVGEVSEVFQSTTIASDE